MGRGCWPSCGPRIVEETVGVVDLQQCVWPCVLLGCMDHTTACDPGTGINRCSNCQPDLSPNKDGSPVAKWHCFIHTHTGAARCPKTRNSRRSNLQNACEIPQNWLLCKLAYSTVPVRRMKPTEYEEQQKTVLQCTNHALLHCTTMKRTLFITVCTKHALLYSTTM